MNIDVQTQERTTYTYKKIQLLAYYLSFLLK